jgi:hypothetical protein
MKSGVQSARLTGSAPDRRCEPPAGSSFGLCLIVVRPRRGSTGAGVPNPLDASMLSRAFSRSVGRGRGRGIA